MSEHDSDPQPNGLDRLNAVLTLILTAAVILFVLGLAIRMGYGLIAALVPEQAEAAAVETATPLPPVTTLPEATPVTPVPTSTPLPTPTPEPTPLPPTPVPPAPRLVAGDGGVNVRRGPSTDYDKVGFLDRGTEAPVTGRYENWWRVTYEGATAYVSGDYATAFDAEGVPDVPATDLPGPTVTAPIFEPAPTGSITEDRWIDVDLSEQRLTAYEGQTPVQSYLVSTGLPGTPTPVGQFRIYVKYRYDDMEGPGYYLKDVPFVMYFYQGYGLHGVWWHANWGHQMSHGCINQPNDMAEWLFGFAEVGTLVNIHE